MSEDAAAWVEYVTRPRINADPSVAVATKQRADAANAVRAMLEGPVSESCPASILRTRPGATLWLDAASASLL